MKARLRRAHVRLDVTTETGERKSVIISHRPREGAPPPVLLNLMVMSLAQFGIELVDELDQPATPHQPDTERPPALPPASTAADHAPPVPAAPRPPAFVHVAPPAHMGPSTDNAPPRAPEVVHRPPAVPDRLPPGPVIQVKDPGAPPPPVAPAGVVVQGAAASAAVVTAGSDNAPPVRHPVPAAAPPAAPSTAHAPMARGAYPPSSVVVRATSAPQPGPIQPDNSAPMRVGTAQVVVGGTSTPDVGRPAPAVPAPSSTQNDNAPPVKQ